MRTWLHPSICRRSAVAWIQLAPNVGAINTWKVSIPPPFFKFHQIQQSTFVETLIENLPKQKWTDCLILTDGRLSPFNWLESRGFSLLANTTGFKLSCVNIFITKLIMTILTLLAMASIICWVAVPLIPHVSRTSSTDKTIQKKMYSPLTSCRGVINVSLFDQPSKRPIYCCLQFFNNTCTQLSPSEFSYLRHILWQKMMLKWKKILRIWMGDQNMCSPPFHPPLSLDLHRASKKWR